MIGIITAIILLASILLVFVVYIQNPKGGGLSSDFGAAQQIGGVQKTNDFIDKATWSLAVIVGIGSIALTMMTKSDYVAPVKQEDAKENTEGAPGAAGENGSNTGNSSNQ